MSVKLTTTELPNQVIISNLKKIKSSLNFDCFVAITYLYKWVT